MTKFLLPFMLLAALGLLLSFAAHLSALLGMTLPGGPLVWSLHAGIFVVWLPTVLVANKMTAGSNRRDFWKVALSGCPAWMRQALYILFAYAVLNFIFFMLTTAGHAKSDGVVTPAVIRGFSGHWMIFYGAAFATLYSAIQSPALLRQQKCPNGHPVSAADKFCPLCGRPLDRTDVSNKASVSP